MVGTTTPVNGGVSSGTPFQDLQENVDVVENDLQAQIDDQQLQINALVADVEELAGDLADELLARVAAINDLQNQLNTLDAETEADIADLLLQLDNNNLELVQLLLDSYKG